MKNIYQYLQKQEQELKSIVELLSQRNFKEIDGHLKISGTGEKVSYYHIYKDPKTGENKKSYIPKKEKNAAKMLAQKDYEKRLLQHAKQQYALIQNMLKHYDERMLIDVINKMGVERKKLIEPVVLGDEEYIRQWEKVEYSSTLDRYELPGIATEKGGLVRSKIEKILADKYYSMGVPYRYEYPVKLMDNGKEVTVNTDFILLKVKDRTEVLHEHFGMMDVPEYAEKAIRKIELYEKNGFYPGENFLLSFETKTKPLDLKTHELLVKSILEM